MDNIKSIVGQVIQQMSGSSSTPQRLEEWLKEHWTPEEAKHIRLIGIKDKTIAFQVDAPAWVYHFESQKSALLKRVQQLQPNVTNIRLRLGQIT